MPTPFARTGKWGRAIFRFAWKMSVVFIVLSFALVLLLRWIDPPASAFMLRQRMCGIVVEYRWVEMERISPTAALAVIASEDQRFFDHWGLDLKAIADAVKDNRHRKRPRGASTISQQVAKNLFLWPGRSYLRKGLEVYFTLLMEACWTKTRILEVYLNIAEMGLGVFGVEAAAQRFFHKPAARLRAEESAALAAVLPSPKRMLADRPSEYVQDRTWQILQQMNGMGGLPFMESKEAINRSP